MKLCRGLPPLRVRFAVRVLWTCFARGRDRFGFRLVQFSIQHDHLHLIAEAPDRASLARGMQGLAVRVAKNLNKAWGRRGTVFADRYHDRVLRTPREVRAALCYVLNNALHHGHRFAQRSDGRAGTPTPARTPTPKPLPDPFSSACWFDGWIEFLVPRAPPAIVPVVEPRTWLLRIGWRRHGRIAFDEVPGRRVS